MGWYNKPHISLPLHDFLIWPKSHLKSLQTVGAGIVLLKHLTYSNKFNEIRGNLLWNTLASFVSISSSFSSGNKSIKYLLQRTRKLLSDGGLSNFLKAGGCLCLVKCFEMFHLNWSFLKFSYFASFRSPYSIETLKCLRQFGLQG